jgi:ribulose-phosphate 3-epimerase
MNKDVVEIIPSINVDNFQEAEARIKLVESYVSWVHLDVSDGIFTPYTSWRDSKDLETFETPLRIELHLMIDKPEESIDKWLSNCVSRVIFHQEATKKHKQIIESIHKAKREVGVAIKPETQWMKLFPFIDNVELLQFLAVSPGPSGQKFDSNILHKLEHMHSLAPGCTIEIDGGVTEQVASQCAHRGATALVVGSAIFDAPNIKEAIINLNNIAEHAR